jgi:hypothetical protein
MHGNVQEWCLDIRHENYHGAPTDGISFRYFVGWAVPSMFILSIPERVRLHAGLMSPDVPRFLQCLAWLENCLHEENGRFYP